MSVHSNGTGLDAAALFNGYVGAHVVYTLDELGVWTRLREGPATLTELAAPGSADRRLLDALLHSAAVLGHVELRDEMVSLTPAGQEVAGNRGFFRWAVGGYGELLRELPALATARKRWGRDVRRDEAQVAEGAADVGRAMMTGIEQRVIAELNYTSVADIGCGDGSRLIRLCQADPPRQGLGIDISEAACALAAKRVAHAGLADHVKVVCQDILKTGDGLAFRGIDLVTSFLMLHDVFAAYPDGASAMRALRHTFPDARYFLIADTNLHPWQLTQGRLPIFSLQFELVHAFMNVPIRPKEVYEAAFLEAGLHIERCEPLGPPSTWLYLLRVTE